MEKFSVTRNGLTYGTVCVVPNGLMTEIDFNGSSPDSAIYRLAAVCNGSFVTLGVAAPDDYGKLTFRKSYSKNALRGLGFSVPEAFELVLPGEIAPALPVGGGVPDAPQSPVPVFAPLIAPAAAGEMSPQVTEGAFVPERVVEDADPYIETPAPFLKGVPSADGGGLNAVFAPVADPSSLFAEPNAYFDGELTGALARREDGVTYLAVPLLIGEPFPLLPIFCFGEPERINGGDYLIFKLNNGILTA